jgi:hypothetical protein
VVAAVPPGSQMRNNTLNNEALKLRPALPALGYEVIEAELLAARAVNGLPEAEARRTILSRADRYR